MIFRKTRKAKYFISNKVFFYFLKIKLTLLFYVKIRADKEIGIFNRLPNQLSPEGRLGGF
jgi:hypothetical protein